MNKSNSYDFETVGKISWPKVSAIDNANVPFINGYIEIFQVQLRTDGLNVGLPEQMGVVSGSTWILVLVGVYQVASKLTLPLHTTL
jgi:hypothetical protein